MERQVKQLERVTSKEWRRGDMLARRLALVAMDVKHDVSLILRGISLVSRSLGHVLVGRGLTAPHDLQGILEASC